MILRFEKKWLLAIYMAIKMAISNIYGYILLKTTVETGIITHIQ
jgi:hypothetical protein